MLRDLTIEEMGLVSGGNDPSSPPPDFGGLDWEWQWAQNDPTVAAQMGLADAVALLDTWVEVNGDYTIVENPNPSADTNHTDSASIETIEDALTTVYEHASGSTVRVEYNETTNVFEVTEIGSV